MYLENIVLLCVLFCPVLSQDSAVLYDAYFGKPITAKRTEYLSTVPNGTALCTVLVRPCRKEEGRRVDGSCSNPKYPSRGATLTPLPRLLPPQFGPGSTLRPAQDGSELPSTRIIRTKLLGHGYSRDHDLSLLATDVFVFAFVDNVDLVYLLRYTLASDCCLNNQIPNRVNPLCIPIVVPPDDPYLRRTNIRCMNLTRVETYQDFGCLPRSLPAERYSRVTPLLDLSLIYGNTEARSKLTRAYQGGLLASRLEGKREVPLGQSIFCLNNQIENQETSCYGFGDEYDGVLLPGIYLGALWFFREHNRIARKLAVINPCWEDQKLYDVAREINIAQWQYIYFYELMPYLLGYKNSLVDGIIYEAPGYVNDFDPNYEPGVYREFVIGCRWFHTLQTGLHDLYRNGKYVGSRRVVTDALRTGYLALNNTEADLTQGAYIQPADKLDYVIDPDIVERIHGERQLASDISAIDMMRGRDAGLPPYNEYRKICGLKYAKKFEDFYDAIDKDRVEELKRLYDDVNDVELMAAIYSERILPDAYVGHTLYCIMANNLLLWRKSDKYFFEHGGFPAALTLPQLQEIRKTNMARVLCDSGDSVKQIQPHALLRRRPWNDIVPCGQIPGADLSMWKVKCPASKK